jgi:hypothetical protein
MSDPTREPTKAAPPGESHAPHPALRALWALGGGPLAFVRADERLAERLSRMTRDEVPAIVRDDGRSIVALAAGVDLASVSSGLGNADQGMHEPNDANAEERQSPLSNVLTKLREQQRTKHDTHSSASSAPLRLPKLFNAKASGAPRAQRSASPPLPGASGHAIGAALAATITEPTAPPRWPSVGAVTAGRTASTTSVPRISGPVRAIVEGAKSANPLAQLLAPSSTAIKAMLADYAANTAPPAPQDAAARAAARLLQITERVERKIAAARAAAGGDLTRQARTARGVGHPPTPSSGEQHRRQQEGDATPSAGAARTSLRAQGGATAPSVAHSTAASFSAPEQAVELRGFRGLAMRAASDETPPGERAPMLQPLRHARRGWDEVDAADAWSLDSAARLEGLDLDEVAS